MQPSPFGQPQAERKPSLEQLQYVKTLLELALLLLAIPWVLVRIVRNPGRAIRDAGESHFG